jgi:hypothetical protein
VIIVNNTLVQAVGKLLLAKDMEGHRHGTMVSYWRNTRKMAQYMGADFLVLRFELVTLLKIPTAYSERKWNRMKCYLVMDT